MTLKQSVAGSLIAALSMSFAGCDNAAPQTSVVTPKELLGGTSQALTGETNYIIVYRLSLPAVTAPLEVSRAGGSIVASYPFGVVVAKSSRANFASEMAKNLLTVESVAATAGAAVDAIPSLPPFNAGNYLPPAGPASATPDELDGMQWNMRAIRAPEARGVTRGKRSVVVGVFDSGIDDSVPDLVGQVDASRSVTCLGGAPDANPARWRNDWIGHGTHVAGIIAAKDDGKGVTGVAPGVSLAAVNMVTDDGLIYPESFLCGLNWAANHGIQVVNASLVLDPFLAWCPGDSTQKPIIDAVGRAISWASDRGTTLVAAASNEFIDLTRAATNPYDGSAIGASCKVLPAESSGVITVSATGGTNKLAYYSNYGLNVVEFAAPGGDLNVPMPGNASGQIVSTIPATSFYYQASVDWNGRVATNCTDGLPPNDPNADASTCDATFALLQGTSQATPHVAGAAALVVSRYGNLTAAGIQTKLALGAKKLPCANVAGASCEGTSAYNSFYGYGLIDVYASIR